MKINGQWAIFLFSVFLLTWGFQKTSSAQQKFNKSVFYTVIASEDTDAINKEINLVSEILLNHKEGYEGALLMKKAGLVVMAKKKLKFFKEGRIKLETALLADSDNTEFHFLRLAIQEHAPKIVKYHSSLGNDKLFLQRNFKSLSTEVQHAILDYCKNSKIIHAEDF